MIGPNATLEIRRVPIAQMVMQEVRPRDLAWVEFYTGIIRGSPTKDAGLIFLEPLPGGYYSVVDGGTRYLAHIIAGRSDALCLIIGEDRTPCR